MHLVRLGIKADKVHHEHDHVGRDEVPHEEHDGLDDEDIII